ncbi:MAG TPA: hydrogenase expression/formation protein HypE [Aquabacterium sp.]|uniref:hydrogenase expression/formation protein HypE n=1 Tax=Aquabacterium sp. TaxID=1872578 RepID=UPI002E36B3A5|nr:hydrogenase expression/formation protein HypE [Aquabacterium sp.]HEX5356885.1 hydrogenase expression/formation protein HypE [Aquabacterium sp.]
MSGSKPGYIRPLDLRHGRVDLTHGAGGRASHQLIEAVFKSAFARTLPAGLPAASDDGTVLPNPLAAMPEGRLVMSTDAHVVSPLFFPGGDIGSLAVHGTVNDLAMMGATPLHLSVSFILEEGLPLADLVQLVQSMTQAAMAARVAIVTGDTKVVERGKADGLYISTAGLGVAPPGLHLSGQLARPGDAILLSGSIGEHGMAVLSQREGLRFEASIVSDCAALNGLVADMLATGARLRVLRDPTRGGLATTLNEIASASQVGMQIDEDAIAVQPAVAAACEFMGLDPLYLANEGKLMAICDAADAPALLQAMQAHPLGRQASRIGTVTDDGHGFVQMRTRFGGQRMLDWLMGDPLPRIC